MFMVKKTGFLLIMLLLFSFFISCKSKSDCYICYKSLFETKGILYYNPRGGAFGFGGLDSYKPEDYAGRGESPEVVGEAIQKQCGCDIDDAIDFGVKQPASSDGNKINLTFVSWKPFCE
ncbi:MAG: hypothetical protein GY754_33595 [bacterium]|nr:hypothetical protein [bacterium]